MLWPIDNIPRSKFDIVSTCYSTLIICIWNAIHVDIPTRRRNWQKFCTFGEQLGWGLIGLLLPDLLCFIAVSQRFNARHIQELAYDHLDLPPLPPSLLYTWFTWFTGKKHVDTSGASHLADNVELGEHLSDWDAQLEDSDKVPSGRQRLHPWTLKHGFYATMGGFVLVTDHPLIGDPREEQDHGGCQTEYDTKGTRFALTMDGVRFVMQHAPDLIPDIPLRTIEDRSKAGFMAKALLLCQILSFCASCTLRLAQSLPLTLLEVTTLAHAFLAVVAWVVWWEKPLNIMEPTLIEGEKASELAAYLLMRGAGRAYIFGGLLYTTGDPEGNHIRACTTSGSTDVHQSASSSPTPELVDQQLPPNPITNHLELEGVTFELPLEQFPPSLPQLQFPWPPDLSRLPMPSDLSLQMRLFLDLWKSKPAAPFRPSSTDILRWKLAARATKDYGVESLTDTIRRPLVTANATLQSAIGSFFVGPNFVPWGAGATTLIAILYAVPHLLASKVPFNSATERGLWLAAATALPVIPLPLAIFAYGAQSNTFGPAIRSISHRSMAFTLNLAPRAYAVATGYLFIASLRQLSNLPPDALREPSISQYWPHFS